MLGLQSAVPVDFRVVEMKRAIGFVNFNIGVKVTGKDLEAESPILAMLAYFVDLVDHGANCGILVQNDLGDELFIREVLFSEIEMCWDTQQRKKLPYSFTHQYDPQL